MNENSARPTQVTFEREDRGFVYAIARRIAASDDEAEDITQDALLLAYRYRHAFRGDSRYRTWLYRIAATTALGYRRKQRRSRECLAPNEEALEIQTPDPGRSPEAVVADAELAEVARKALATLDPKYRSVVMMRLDATEVETAKELGLSVANVKIRAHRARKQLKDAFVGLVEPALAA